MKDRKPAEASDYLPLLRSVILSYTTIAIQIATGITIANNNHCNSNATPSLGKCIEQPTIPSVIKGKSRSALSINTTITTDIQLIITIYINLIFIHIRRVK